jgi:putative mRNA 3-end processing factor
MKLYAFGGAGEVGRSAFVLAGSKRVLLDYGIKVFTENKEPSYPLPLSVDLDAALISHAHLDHVGNVPFLFKDRKVRWYATPPTFEIAKVLWADSLKITPNLPWSLKHQKKAEKYWVPVVYNKRVSLSSDFSFTFYDAGHILGSAMIEINDRGRKVLYSGDFKIEETRMHRGAVYDEEVDVLIIESTYWNREHPKRSEAEHELMREIQEGLEQGGSVLLPAFAVGRSQELISIIRSYDAKVPLFLDGMAKAVTSIYERYRNYLSHPARFKRFVDSVFFVSGIRDKKRATSSPSVIVSTAGMLEGGPALSYLQHLNPMSKILLTGFCLEGTNGWLLLNKQQIKYEGGVLDVSLPVRYIDFSAHAGRSDLFDLINKTQPEKIVVIHGDNTEAFAQELRGMGFDAVAPKPGEVVDLD